MIEKILIEEDKNRKIEVWDVLKEIEREKGEEVFGKYSFFGIESLLVNYVNGKYNNDIHRFYEKYKQYFVGCVNEEKLIESRQRFNKEIKEGNIRYSIN